ncbi:DUF6252 family protein [Pedobacter aquatilis]|uniref:DUF6252 family protein n=1 Tax=Pedobacter aquatilis TaxID=351343 RepID=UPI00292CCDD6|nr:DUF6252 family protein [Pedobacter aquatilis]
MKLSFKTFLLAVFCLVIYSSCKKEIDYHPEWNISSMSAKVDGILLECPIASAQTYPNGTKTTIQISGNKGQTGFSLIIDDFKGVGTYKTTDNNIAIYLSNTSGTGSFMSTANGTIKITSYTADKIITGTFEFESANISNSETKNITEGKFSISLVPVKLPETNSSTNNLNAKIDGVSMGFTGQATIVNIPTGGNALTVISANGEKRIVLGLFEYKGIGTYDLATDGLGSYMKDQTPTGSFTSDSGTLKITSEANGRLKGTFSFKAPNEDSSIKTSVNVTEGSFDLPLGRK